MSNEYNEDDFHTPPRPQITKKGLNIPPTPYLNCLGLGTCVNVWSLNNPSSKSPWAVKSIRNAMDKERNDRYQSLIEREALILADIQHENIIGYRGLLQSLDGRSCLAMESCGRSLGDMVEQRVETGQKPFSPDEIKMVVLHCARALDYLHTSKNLLHGDIKSYNILIKGNFEVVKLCDLGVCVPLNDEGFTTEYSGTLVYNAPEALNDTIDVQRITGKAEIFSLGLVIWEMMTLTIPHCDQIIDVDESSFNSSLSENGLDSSQASLFPDGCLGTRPKLPPNLDPKYDAVVGVFNLCTAADPNERPTAAQLIETIQKL